MRPAWSVIAFTVLAGAGLGALALAALLDALSWDQVIAVRRSDLLHAVVAGLVLVVAGLASSTLHLANPRNAWRSLARWRTSWLSREAAVALVLLPLAALYAAALYQAWHGSRLVLGGLVIVLAVAMLVCTAMIYASLKPIRQWHTRRVPLAFVLLGLASGAVLLLAFVDAAPALRALAAALLLVAAIVKLEYWRYVAAAPGSLTLAQAIGVAHGVRPPAAPGAGPRPSVMAARLFDAGHSRGTFLTHEFLASATPRTLRWVRALALGAGLLLPAALLLVHAGTPVAALAACIIGLMAERWLFFVEARHTVRLYHGEART